MIKEAYCLPISTIFNQHPSQGCYISTESVIS